MKYILLLILSFSLIGITNKHAGISTHSRQITADSILKKMFYKLRSVKKMSYQLKRELNYSSENFHQEEQWSIYFDFQSTDTIIGFKYQTEDEKGKQVFNGTEAFELDKKQKTIKINDTPNEASFNNLSVFYNSIITLKNILPIIIADKSITKSVNDTTVNNLPYYLITLNLNKTRINNLGKDFDVMTTKSNFIYKIVVDKNSSLPFEVLQINDLNNDFIKTTFTGVNTDVKELPELSWYYTTYLPEYKIANESKIPQLIPVGSIALDWTLPVYNKNENLTLSHLKGNIILLDFWIKNCGPCIESVPHLNFLQEKLNKKKFKIVSINCYDPKSDIAWFCNKHSTAYEVLMNGKGVAEKYGVPGFPTVILIDKQGKVFYSSVGFDKLKIEELIEAAL